MESLTAKASIQIQKEAHLIYEAIVNPDQMTQYFISESTGRMESGSILTWKFPEFPDYISQVTDIRLIQNKEVSFVWDGETTVKIILEEQVDKSTVIRVTEGEKPLNENSLKWVIGNTEGWANFLACMKAWLEYGIHLRKGAFEFYRTN